MRESNEDRDPRTGQTPTVYYVLEFIQPTEEPNLDKFTVYDPLIYNTTTFTI